MSANSVAHYNQCEAAEYTKQLDSQRHPVGYIKQLQFFKSCQSAEQETKWLKKLLMLVLIGELDTSSVGILLRNDPAETANLSNYAAAILRRSLFAWGRELLVVLIINIMSFGRFGVVVRCNEF